LRDVAGNHFCGGWCVFDSWCVVCGDDTVWFGAVSACFRSILFLFWVWVETLGASAGSSRRLRHFSHGVLHVLQRGRPRPPSHAKPYARIQHPWVVVPTFVLSLKSSVHTSDPTITRFATYLPFPFTQSDSGPTLKLNYVVILIPPPPQRTVGVVARQHLSASRIQGGGGGKGGIQSFCQIIHLRPALPPKGGPPTPRWSLGGGVGAGSCAH